MKNSVSCGLQKKDKLMLKNQFKTLYIILNAQYVNGMTPFDLTIHWEKYMYVYSVLEYCVWIVEWQLLEWILFFVV